uniref:Uncharacterized protein n=1 Tax=Arundo donax TaxID=35708 RepID=A0A0A9FYE7_ARUDO
MVLVISQSQLKNRLVVDSEVGAYIYCIRFGDISC